MKMEYSQWKKDYLPNDGDDDRMLRIKTVVDGLNSVQKKIFLTYVELGSYAAVGREYGVSTPTARTYIREIREKIMEQL